MKSTYDRNFNFLLWSDKVCGIIDNEIYYIYIRAFSLFHFGGPEYKKDTLTTWPMNGMFLMHMKMLYQFNLNLDFNHFRNNLIIRELLMPYSTVLTVRFEKW